MVRLTPSALQTIRWRVYILFAALNACWVVVIALLLPETNHLTLEEVDELFTTDDWKLELAQRGRRLDGDRGGLEGGSALQRW